MAKILIFLLTLAACNCDPIKKSFECPDLGDYPNPEDCSTFYACVEGNIPILMECPDGLLFDPNLKICNLAGNVDCAGSGASTTTTTTVPTTVSSSSLPNTAAPSSSSEPSEEPSAPTTSSYTNSFPPTLYPLPECPSTGQTVLSNSYDCTSFYICLNGEPNLISCSEGSEFNKITGVCEDPSTAGCSIPWATGTIPNFSSTSIPPSDALCINRPNGAVFPDPSDCSGFYQCSNGEALESHCPSGLLFNEKLEVCDLPENVDCIRNLQMLLNVSMK